MDGSATTQATVTLAGTDGVVISDDGTMKQALVSDFEVYMEANLDTMGSQFTSASSLATVGDLNSGSITSGFGAINNGESTITTTGTVSTGALTVGGNIDFNSDTIDLSTQTVDVTLNGAVDALNFNSNTLSIDASNNRVGIGTTSPAHKLDVAGDIGVAGNYIINEQGRQDHVANTMPASYYRFDGVDDYITITDDADLDFGTGDFTVLVWFKTSDGGRIWQKRTDNNNEIGMYLHSSFIRGLAEIGGAGVVKQQIDSDFTDDTWRCAIWVVDRDSTENSKMYINGVSQTLGTNTVDSGANDLDYGNMHIGSRDGSEGWFDGQLTQIRFFNKALTATEVKELYSGASVPFKYKGASQTDLLSGWDFTSGWTADSGVNIVDINTYTNTWGDERGVIWDTDLEIGKEYSLTYDLSASTGTCHIDCGGELFSPVASPSGTVVFTASAVRLQVRSLVTPNTSLTVDVTTLSITQIGAVAEYDGSGASEEHWFDTSGNDLHGDVTGATLNNQGDGGATKAITLTPRALPSTANASEGQIVYDSSANKLKVYNGSAWETITSS
jgi:hypothetical protein